MTALNDRFDNYGLRIVAYLKRPQLRTKWSAQHMHRLNIENGQIEMRYTYYITTTLHSLYARFYIYLATSAIRSRCKNKMQQETAFLKHKKAYGHVSFLPCLEALQAARRLLQ